MKNFNVYKSSAGSGKTYTLVKEYLKLCLKSESPFVFASILAITFTNKATYEMKNRILLALKELSIINPESSLKSQIAKELSLEKSIITQRSERILKTILHNYADFSISTIDRFSHRIIRTFSKDLQLSQNFHVELNEQELLKRVVAEIMDTIGKEKELSALLLEYTLYQIEAEKSWKIENEVVKFASGLLKEKSMPFLEALRKVKKEQFKTLKNKYAESNAVFENKLKDIGSAAMKLINDGGINTAAFAGSSKAHLYFTKLQDLVVDGFVPTNQLIGNVEKDNWTVSKCDPQDASAIEGIAPQLKEYFETAHELVIGQMPNYLARKEILKNIHNLMLLNEIEKRFATLKKEERILNISDLNKLISKVVLAEPMPFIYERLGEKYQHIMIDEFQDTSVLQFMNLLPLIDDSLANGKKNLIVGDAKQAIYRFRGGEVDQFSEMPEYKPEIADEFGLIESRLLTLKSQYGKVELNDNWRSSKFVVEFNNAFFHAIKNRPDVPEKVLQIYSEHKQKPQKVKDDGLVQLTFSEGKGEELEESYLRRVLGSIDDCLASKYDLRGITILCRTKKEANKIADYLLEQQIEVISSEALLLQNSAKVDFLINAGKLVYLEREDKVLKDLVSFLVNSSRLQGSLHENFVKYLNGENGVSSLLNELGIHKEKLSAKSIHEFFEAIIRLVGFDETYDVYIQSLQDAALEFQNTTSSSMLLFLAWWEENGSKLSLDVPDDLNAVQIMTIHKSKGLEFPVVIYPFANSKVELSGSFKSNYLWSETVQEPKVNVPFALVEFNNNLKNSALSHHFDEEQEKKSVDLINDTYVALTRAAERLYIHSELPPKKSERLGLPQMLMDFAISEMQEKGEGVFENGVESQKENTNTKQTESGSFEMKYYSEAWSSKLQISAESALKWGNEELLAQLKYGNLLHDILSKINDYQEFESVLLQLQYQGILTHEEVVSFSKQLSQLFQNEEIKRFFDSRYKSKREQSLFTDSGELLRPDHVTYFDDSVAVLDFKTGEANESHAEQVLQYMHSIQKMNDKKVEGFILYTESGKLVSV